jgi:hypothetical protein
MLGSVVLALVALTVVATGTASATTLCKENVSPCGAGKKWPSATVFTAQSQEAIFAGSISVTCGSEMIFKTNEETGAPLNATTEALTWTTCAGCNPLATKVLPALTIASSGGGSGTLSTGKVEVEMKNCLGFVTCKATAATTSVTFSGGPGGSGANDSRLKADNVPFVFSGGLCGTSGTLNAGGAHGGLPYVVVKAEVGGVTTNNPAVFVAASP